ncbi:MAG: acyl-ACP--UDP-N-acetylglucosamine O-acyltransferase [Desulfatibacillum sp.]|nr:acyl-ACP--UDP-N-acetylglucosamine O-acyltransferase [Desulfatibacillum sp.]
MIHEQAIVHKDAEIGNNVSIGPFTVIEKNVKIGDNTVIGSMVTIDEFTSIGADCTIFHHAAIGAAPQSVKFAGEETHVEIGDRCLIREFVTIHRGTGFGGGLTRLGNDNFLMAYTHIAHDCITGNGVVFANAATLAGHIEIGNHATVGGLVAIHQFARIGDYAFVGGKSAVTKDIPPYVIAAGDRARLHGLNKVGLKRHGFTPEVLDALKKAYRIIFRIGLTLNEAIERVKAEVPDLPEVNTFLHFLESSKRGVTRGKPGRD